MIYFISTGEYSDYEVNGVYEGPPNIDIEALWANLNHHQLALVDAMISETPGYWTTNCACREWPQDHPGLCRVRIARDLWEKTARNAFDGQSILDWFIDQLATHGIKKIDWTEAHLPEFNATNRRPKASKSATSCSASVAAGCTHTSFPAATA